MSKITKKSLINTAINILPSRQRKYLVVLLSIMSIYAAYNQHQNNKYLIKNNAVMLNSSENNSYKFLHISDGDTFSVQKGEDTLKIRLAYIDAPEKKQYLGNEAGQELENLCKDSTINIEQTGLSYNRIVAVVNCNGIAVNKYMLEKGLASLDDRYSKNQPDYYMLQAQAQQEKIGIWAKEFISPQTCRKDKICN